MLRETYHICEYGIICNTTDYDEVEANSLDRLILPDNHFNSLHKYISQNQDESTEGEKPFSLFSKGKRKYIKVKNYVGVIETKEGLHLEILPKIVTRSTTERGKLDETKQVFIKMLRHLKNSPFVNISMAHINSQKDFPILEVFIKSYINEVESIFNKGIKSDYILNERNVSYLKGKLKINQNIKHNFANKARFYCEFSEYSPNISANIIIKTTLLKLMKETISHSSYLSINKILHHLEDVSISTNVEKDFAKVQSASRRFLMYRTALMWSEIFLTNKSFTNFKGDTLNMAILFPMEKIFEDYIAYLFMKYAYGYRIKLQDKSYFLINQRTNEISGRYTKQTFGLKPDIVIDSDKSKTAIVDTKWKLLNQYAEKKNYDISQADMYQLYAYGKKYTRNNVDPHLVLLYPSNPNFTQKLDNFIYEGDLSLEVVPFDFNKHERDAINDVLNLIVK